MFPQGNQVADYLERYPYMIGLNVSTSTSLLRTTFERNSWKVCLQNGSGEWDIRARHLVLATGVDLLGNMRAKMPSWTGMVREFSRSCLPHHSPSKHHQSDFRGTILHSTAVKDCSAFAGKQAVVIGSGCSGHDIAQALWEGGAVSVTLVQRSATAVVSESTLLTCFPGNSSFQSYTMSHVCSPAYLQIYTLGRTHPRSTSMIGFSSHYRVVLVKSCGMPSRRRLHQWTSAFTFLMISRACPNSRC